MHTTRFGIACALALSLSATPAVAVEWGASFGSGIIYTDNLERVPGGNGVTIATADAAGQLIGFSDNFELDVEAGVIGRNYLDASYETDVLPQLRAVANWAPFPEYFVWTVRNNFGQIALTPSEILQPFDRQDINVFSTGPALTIPLTTRTNVQLAGLYSDVYYENDDFDYERMASSVLIERELSVNSVAYVRAYQNRTDFKDQQFGGYDFLGYFVGYQGVGARTGLTVEAGIEELHDGAESDDGPYVRLDIDRELGPQTTAALRYLSRYADSADIFSIEQNLEPRLGGTLNVFASDEPVWYENALLEFKWEGSRTTMAALASWSDEDVDSTVSPDREIYGGGVRATRTLTESLTIGVQAYLYREIWSDAVERTQDDVAVVADVEMRLTPKISLQTFVEAYRRNNSPANYDENRFMLLVRYTPQAVTRELPSFYERRLNRRFSAGRPAQQDQGSTTGPRINP